MRDVDLPFRVLPEPSLARGISGGLALSLAVHAAVLLLLVAAAMRVPALRVVSPPVIEVMLIGEPKPPQPAAGAGAPPEASKPRVPPRVRAVRPPAAPPGPPAETPRSPLAPLAPAPRESGAAGEPAAERSTPPPSEARREPGGAEGMQQVFEAGEVERAARALERPAPAYPERARRLGREADRQVLVVVGADGRVREARVVDGRDDEFDRAAVDGVRKWRFSPARRGGANVASRATVTVRFRLDR